VRSKEGKDLVRYRARLVTLFERLDDEGQRTLVEHAEFLVSRSASAEPAPTVVETGPPGERVLEAVRRLNRSYPGLRRAALLPQVGELLSQHLVDARAAAEVVAELEALYARAHAARGGGRTI
jgi:hypothetical protein